jgi:hypothetical protein
MSTPESANALLAAFVRVRSTAESYMDERDRAGLGWAEDVVSALAVHKGQPVVEVVEFNRDQEGRGVGADYLWWWLDRASDECFGMLVQAKRLLRHHGRWEVDIRHRAGRQYRDLLATADQFQVPAIYAVYTGGLVFRSSLPCTHQKSLGCITCRRMTISLIAAYQLSTDASAVETAGRVFNESIPLEDLVDPALAAGPVWDLNLPEVGPGSLRDFLINEQQGPQEVARRIFSAVSQRRRRSFAVALAGRVALPSDQVFRQLPSDTGHFPGPYFPHVLQRLRTHPPSYVLDLLGGRPASPGLVDRVAGVVMVTP